MSVHHKQAMTYEQYSRLPEEDGFRYELTDGELYVSAAPKPRHQAVFGLAAESYGEPSFFTSGDQLITPAIPGLRVDLCYVFKRQ